MTMRCAQLAPEHLRSEVIKTEHRTLRVHALNPLKFQRKRQRISLASRWGFSQVRGNWLPGQDSNLRPSD